jgi:hypothetical protein
MFGRHLWSEAWFGSSVENAIKFEITVHIQLLSFDAVLNSVRLSAQHI